MNELKLIISPKTKVGELLDAFPQLEKVLIELSPSFAKLRNPILRRTVARVASLQQAAAVGGLPVEDLVNRLRKEAGQEFFAGQAENNSYLPADVPSWFTPDRVSQRFDASPIINSGGSPLGEILSKAQMLMNGEILELKTPFIPAPVIDMLKDRGFTTFCMQKEGHIISYIRKI